MGYRVLNRTTGESALIEADNPDEALELHIEDNYTQEVASMLDRDQFSVEWS